METRFLLRASQRLRAPLRPAQKCLFSSSNSNSKTSTQQVNAIGDYYASILSTPSPSKPSAQPKPINSSNAPPKFTTTSVDSIAKPTIIFSSRLSSPLERHAEVQKKSVLVAGVWVPPKPDEPDDCCMSGCVNCVWDRYGEEIEEWAMAKREADVAMRKEKGFEDGKRRRKGSGSGLVLGEAVSMDDDGGGSESNWGTGLETEFVKEDLLKGVPVGIREFMKQEKRLKEKHAKDGTVG